MAIWMWIKRKKFCIVVLTKKKPSVGDVKRLIVNVKNLFMLFFSADVSLVGQKKKKIKIRFVCSHLEFGLKSVDGMIVPLLMLKRIEKFDYKIDERISTDYERWQSIQGSDAVDVIGRTSAYFRTKIFSSSSALDQPKIAANIGFFFPFSLLTGMTTDSVFTWMKIISIMLKTETTWQQNDNEKFKCSEIL